MQLDALDQATDQPKRFGAQFGICECRVQLGRCSRSGRSDAREQATAAGDVLYRRGQRAGEYLTQNVNEYPLTALLIAA